MSEPIPESIPTSADPRSHRPIKRTRLANTPSSAQSQAVEALFARQPDIQIPSSALTKSKTLAPPPEIVTNVQGSSAGAGSGEFHVYKASRRREYERMRMMEEESRKEEGDRKWEEEERERKKKDEEKTSKNAKKRAKARERKAGGGFGGVKDGNVQGVKRLGALNVGRPREPGDGEDGRDGEGTPAVEEQGIVIHDDD